MKTDKAKIAAGDPREKRLMEAWRLLKKQPALRTDFFRLIEHLRGGRR